MRSWLRVVSAVAASPALRATAPRPVPASRSAGSQARRGSRCGGGREAHVVLFRRHRRQAARRRLGDQRLDFAGIVGVVIGETARGAATRAPIASSVAKNFSGRAMPAKASTGRPTSARRRSRRAASAARKIGFSGAGARRRAERARRAADDDLGRHERQLRAPAARATARRESIGRCRTPPRRRSPRRRNPWRARGFAARRRAPATLAPRAIARRAAATRSAPTKHGATRASSSGSSPTRARVVDRGVDLDRLGARGAAVAARQERDALAGVLQHARHGDRGRRLAGAAERRNCRRRRRRPSTRAPGRAMRRAVAAP